MTPNEEALIKATKCFIEGSSLASKYMAITDDPTSLASVVGSMLFAKFCKAEFIASVDGERENEASLFLQEMEEMTDLKTSDFVQYLKKL